MPLATVALGLDDGGVQAGHQRALGRDVDEAVGPADKHMSWLSVKPRKNFLDHCDIDPSCEVGWAERFFARDSQRENEPRIADFNRMKLF